MASSPGTDPAATLVPRIPDARYSYVKEQYPAMVRSNGLRAGDLVRMRAAASEFGYRPLISVVLPVYNSEPEWLRQALDSVLRQVYPQWELCICDDGSTGEHVRRTLSLYERLDERVKVMYLERNTGISGASNTALSMATGEFVALLDHDDELSVDALFEVARLLQDQPEADLIYSDVDKLDERGRRVDPHFKPDWSPDLLFSTNYISHLGVYRRSIMERVGGFREGFEGAQDYDLVLRFTEHTGNVHHIPKVLYHWRMVTGSLALHRENKPYIAGSARRALSEALVRRGLRASVEPGLLHNRYRVRFEIEGEPKVSIIIPTRDNVSLLRKCIKSIESLTTYPNYEIVVVDNDSSDGETLEYLASSPHRVIRCGGPFNYSKINNFAAVHTEGEHLLFLNDDTEVISGGWIEAMLEHAQRPEVGAVGAKLLYPNGRIQHAGVITGGGQPWGPGVAVSSHSDYPASSHGYAGNVSVIRNYSAVTAACMMVRKSVFDELGGFDETNLPLAFNDVDLCLRLQERGYSVVYTPYAVLYHHESASRGYESDLEGFLYMRKRWGARLDRDPYYNPNLSPGAGDFNLRADRLRPQILNEEAGEPPDGKHFRQLSGEELRQYLESQRRNARSSRRTTLVPKPAADKV